MTDRRGRDSHLDRRRPCKRCPYHSFLVQEFAVPAQGHLCVSMKYKMRQANQRALESNFYRSGDELSRHCIEGSTQNSIMQTLGV